MLNRLKASSYVVALKELGKSAAEVMTVPMTWQAQLARQMDLKNAVRESGMNPKAAKKLELDLSYLGMGHTEYTQWKKRHVVASAPASDVVSDQKPVPKGPGK